MQRYGRERYRKLLENKKQKSLEYRESYYKTLKSVSYFLANFLSVPNF